MPLPFWLGSPARRDFAVFGKLPGRADFLRVNASLPVCEELDESLHAALAELAWAPGWQEHYDRLPVHDLFWASERSGTAFLGSAIPSQDSSGRRYPFLAGLVLDLQDARKRGPLLPLAGELLLNQVRHFLQVAVTCEPEVRHLVEYLRVQASGRGHDFLDEEITFDLYRKFLGKEPWWELGRSLSAEAPEAALQVALLHLLFHTYATPKGLGLGQRSASLPLLAEPGRTGLHLVGWLDVLQHLSAASPSRTWNRQWLVRQHAQRPKLLAHPGAASSRELAGMLLDDPAPDLQLRVQAGTRPWHHHPLFPEISYQFDQFRKIQGRSMMDLLGFLKETSRQFSSPNQ
jgi:type VI secretion system protein ImpM